LNSSQSYTIRELTPDLLADYLAFFDRDAFADHPEWAFCYCRLHHFPHETRTWRESTADENRAAVIDLIRDGTLRGYLAYHGAKPVAWCNAGPRTRMTTVPEYEEPEADRIGSIMCFVVAKEYRRKGVARQLLDAACAGFAAQGFAIAEGYPLEDAEGEAANHCGPLDLYLSAGFERYRKDEDAIVVRRSLVRS
jgi:ribosomal protein S18 acetylase RimI-like enzyme